MKKVAIIKQRDTTDCGAACLASIAAYYKLRMPIARIRQIAGTDQKGTNALGMLEAAEKMGFSGKGVRGELEALPTVATPCIAHVILKNNLHHYVVISRVSPKHIYVMDPGIGRIIKYKKAEFGEIWSGVLLLLSPNCSFTKGNETISLIQRISFLIKSHRGVLIQAVIGAMLFTIIGLSGAVFVQKIIDSVIPSHNRNLLNLLGLGMIVLLVFQVLLNVLKSILVLKVGQQIDAKLILGYYKHILTLPQRFFDTMRVGEITSRIGDAVKIRLFLNQTAIDIIINAFVLIFSFGLMFTYYWKLAVIMLLVIPLYFGIYLVINQFNRKTERRIMENGAELESQLVESLKAVKTIKMHGVEEHANAKTEIRFVTLLSSIFTSGLNGIFAGNSTFVVSRVFTIILLWIGTGYVMNLIITPGELMSFYAIIGYFTGPVGSLIGANKSYQNARIAADRLFEVMDLEQDDTTNQIKVDRSEMGDIRFENVSFRYGTRVQVFEDFNLRIKKGKISAIIGESGSGKSTIASLVKRLYPVDKGHILIGSYDLSMIDKAAISEFIGIVPQQIDLFAGSLIQNIAVGHFNPDIKRIVNLAQELGMMDFINELPNGFGAYLGENGVNLSGGQRQRISILRALYSDPEIIIFDEATSALDSRSEEFLLRIMQKLRNKGKTIITITHRLNSVRNADVIFLLEKGKLIGQGNHGQLILNNPSYRKFWELQNGQVQLNGHG